MKRKAVLENLAKNLYGTLMERPSFETHLNKFKYKVDLYAKSSFLTMGQFSGMVVFKLEFKEMKREMFSGIDFGEYDQQILYGSIRQEYLDAPIWCRARNAGDYLVEYMMVKDGGNYVQVEIRNFELGVYKK